MFSLYRAYAPLIFFMLATNAFGQRHQPPLLLVEERIDEIEQKIAQCKSEDEDSSSYCGVYKTTIVVNENRQQWRAVGNYEKNITFWFNDQPRFVKMSDLPSSAALLKVTVEEELAIYWSRTEYFVNRHGALIRVTHEETKAGTQAVAFVYSWSENGTIDEDISVYDEEERDFIQKPDRVQENFSELVRLFEATF